MNTQRTDQLELYLEELATIPGFIEVTINKVSRGKAFPTTGDGRRKCVAFIAQWEALDNEMHISAAARWREPTGKNGRAVEADVTQVPHLWVDIDRPDAQAVLDAFDVPPTMTVASGRDGHRQAYWRLDQPAPIDDGKPVMQLLNRTLYGDSTANYDRVMRPPGTTNRKPEANGAIVEIVHHDDRTVTLEELVAACPSAPAVAPAAAPAAAAAPEHDWDTTKQSLATEEVERLDRVTNDTPSKDKSRVKEHAKRQLVHARTALANAATIQRPYGAQQLLGVARDIGRCLGGGLLYKDALRMLTDFELEMSPETEEQRANNARAIRRGLAQGADRPRRPGMDRVPQAAVSQDVAGGLRTHGGRTMCATMGEEGPSESMFMDGAIKVVGVVGTHEPGVNEAYEIELTIGDRTFEQYLEVSVLADVKQFRAWCLARGLSTYGVNNSTPAGLLPDQRLNKFLLSQGAPASTVVPNLGWHPSSQAFLTMEGRITADGFEPGFAGVRPHPRLVRDKLAGHRYGTTRSAQEAREALKEILTWQHPMTAALVGSWWATTFLKNHIRLAAGDGLYPFLGLEGNSGTGKTSGMLKSLVEISGAPSKPTSGNTTIAKFRSMLGAHNSGIVWLDDSDHVEDVALWELIRGTTGDAVYGKKHSDHLKNVEEPLTAAVIISGEGLNVRGQKANEERCVLVTPEDPTDRMDLRDASRPQWEAITEFRRANPDLNEFSASMVAMALQHAGDIAKLPHLTGGLPGRRGEKAAILRLGAIVLEKMTESPEGTFGKLVDTWIQEHVVPETLNAFESMFLQQLLVVCPPVSLAGGINGDPGRAGPPILFGPDREYYVSIARGMQWCKDKRLDIPARLNNANSLADQAKAAGCEKQRVRVGSEQIVLWRLPRIMTIRLGLIEDDPQAELPDLDHQFPGV